MKCEHPYYERIMETNKTSIVAELEVSFKHKAVINELESYFTSGIIASSLDTSEPRSYKHYAKMLLDMLTAHPAAHSGFHLRMVIQNVDIYNRLCTADRNPP